MTTDKVRLTIDGVEIEAPSGQTVIEAARQAGIYIPYLCWHPILKPYGACRMCIVQTNKTPGLPASCHTTVMDEMEVITTSDDIEEVRRDILALTLVNHPHGCLTCWRIEHCGPKDVCLRNVTVTDRCVVCPQNERCELQDVTYYVKLNEVPLPYKYRNIPLETRNPFIDHDMNLCIVCGKCVRACDELEGVNAITFEDRGNDTIVGTALKGTLADSGCTFCGLCVDVCPVGAITEKDSKWAGRADEFVTTACAHCSVGCSLDLNVKNGKLIRVTHNYEASPGLGQECVQGKFGYKWISSDQRLTKPMVRRDGALQETSWDEAIQTVADGLSRFRPDEIALVGSPKVTNEDNFLLQKLGRAVLGVSNIDFIDPLCPPSALAGLDEAFGATAATGSLTDLREARLVFVVDSDLTFEHPVAGLQVKEAVRRGAHLVVLDPRDTELGLQASEKMVCRPGAEVAVLGAIARAIVDEGLADDEYIGSHCEQLHALRDSLGPFTLEAAESLSGVPAAQMTQVARLLAAHKPGVFVFSPSLTGESPALSVAVADLALLTGNVGRTGSGVFPMLGENNSQGAADMGCRPAMFPGGVPVTSAGAWLRFREAWGDRVPNTPGLGLPETLAAINAGKIKAMVLLGENQVLPDPDGELAEALGKLELLVVHEVFLRDLASHAHVALPATTFAERDGTYTSFERRVQRVRRAVEPMGEARPAWQVVCEIARKMGAEKFDYAGASEVFDEIARLVPAYGGMSYRRLEADGLQWPCPDAEHPGTGSPYSQRFPRGRGRFRPLSWPDSAGRPDTLIALASVTREIMGVKELGYQNLAELNATDARRLDVADGERINLVSAMGTLVANARVNGRAPEGTVLVTMPQYNMVTDVWNQKTPGPLVMFTRAKRYPVRIEKAAG
ncbi:MAG: molybdopterin-dependent oxidoreductase [Chloroflexi bacterium]|nr:molybdopterin-dependent oxidoreductase [Chloroflexota bacterium]